MKTYVIGLSEDVTPDYKLVCIILDNTLFFLYGLRADYDYHMYQVSDFKKRIIKDSPTTFEKYWPLSAYKKKLATIKRPIKLPNDICKQMVEQLCGKQKRRYKIGGSHFVKQGDNTYLINTKGVSGSYGKVDKRVWACEEAKQTIKDFFKQYNITVDFGPSDHYT